MKRSQTGRRSIGRAIHRSAKRKGNGQVAALVPAGRLSEDQAMTMTFAQLARDPSVDVAKLERLIAMQERVLALQAKAAFTGAFVPMQADLPEIDEQGQILDRGGHVQSRYACYEDIQKVVKPILVRHGFALDFRTEFLGDNGTLIKTIGMLTHRAGHTKTSEFVSVADPSGSKNAIQGIGSTRSYGRRYTTLDLLNITSRAPVDRDDDGQAAGREPPPQPAQRKSQQSAASDPSQADSSPHQSPPSPAGAAVEKKSESPAPSSSPHPSVVPLPKPAYVNVGRIAQLEDRGDALLVKLDTGYEAATRDPEMIRALRVHHQVKTTIEVLTRPSRDPKRFAPIVEEIQIQRREPGEEG